MYYILYCIILYHIISYHITSYRIRLYFILFYYIILYYIISLIIMYIIDYVIDISDGFSCHKLRLWSVWRWTDTKSEGFEVRLHDPVHWLSCNVKNQNKLLTTLQQRVTGTMVQKLLVSRLLQESLAKSVRLGCGLLLWDFGHLCCLGKYSDDSIAPTTKKVMK